MGWGITAEETDGLIGRDLPSFEFVEQGAAAV